MRCIMHNKMLGKGTSLDRCLAGVRLRRSIWDVQVEPEKAKEFATRPRRVDNSSTLVGLTSNLKHSYREDYAHTMRSRDGKLLFLLVICLKICRHAYHHPLNDVDVDGGQSVVRSYLFHACNRHSPPSS